MTFEELLNSMTPEIHASMKQAVEVGKWPNGKRLEGAEREACLRAVIAYDAQHLPEQERVGYIDRSKADGSQHGPSRNADDIIRFINN